MLMALTRALPSVIRESACRSVVELGMPGYCGSGCAGGMPILLAIDRILSGPFFMLVDMSTNAVLIDCSSA